MNPSGQLNSIAWSFNFFRVFLGTGGLAYGTGGVAYRPGRPLVEREGAAVHKFAPASAEGGGDCAICLECMPAGGASTCDNCRGTFHAACVESWMTHRRSCPMCRVAIA